MNEKFINNKSTLDNFYINKGYSYMRSLLRQSLIIKLNCFIINLFNKNKLLKYFKIFSKNFLFQKRKRNKLLKNTFLKLKLPNSVYLANSCSIHKLCLKKKKMNTTIEVNTFSYFFHKYINNYKGNNSIYEKANINIVKSPNTNLNFTGYNQHKSSLSNSNSKLLEKYSNDNINNYKDNINYFIDFKSFKKSTKNIRRRHSMVI